MYALNKNSREVEYLFVGDFKSKTSEEEAMDLLLNGENQEYLKIEGPILAYLVEKLEDAGLRVVRVDNTRVYISGENKEFINAANRLCKYGEFYKSEMDSILYFHTDSFRNILEIHFAAVNSILLHRGNNSFIPDMLGIEKIHARENMLIITIKIIDKIIEEYSS